MRYGEWILLPWNSDTFTRTTFKEKLEVGTTEWIFKVNPGGYVKESNATNNIFKINGTIKDLESFGNKSRLEEYQTFR